MAGKKQERKAQPIKKIEEEKNALKVSELAQEYFKRQIVGNWKHPDILRRRIEKDINPNIGYLNVEDVRLFVLMKIIAHNGCIVDNNVIRWTRCIFNYGIKHHMLETNPTTAFEIADTGGKEKSCERWLSKEKLVKFFQAVQITKGFFRQNELTIKLLLALCCKKMELGGLSFI